ncbi:MAG: NADH-quinone oxidoreductase subunit NuoE [Thermodesulfobacteriota bacterium]
MELKEKIEDIVKIYPDKGSALLPALHAAQEKYGHLTKEAMEEVAEILAIPPIEVYEVATFYTMYNKKPVGKYHVQVCTNVSCSLLGSEHLLDFLERRLEIKAGETTRDNIFTLTAVECLGSCGTAPVVQINDTYYENLTEEKLDDILSKLNNTKEIVTTTITL